MKTRPFPQSLRSKISRLALIALVICPSCATERISAEENPRIASERHKGRPPDLPPPNLQRARQGRPDPRYRPAIAFSELQAVAGEVARATGRKINWRLERGADPGPLASITGDVDGCTIRIHPVAARKVPPNTWAFIFGHEFAHLVEKLGAHSQTNPSNELKADIAGARYAMAAGYRLDAFLGWVLAEPDKNSQSHGTLRQRVHAIAARFGLQQNVIQAAARRYANYRASY